MPLSQSYLPKSRSDLLALLMRLSSACRSRCSVPIALSQLTATWLAFFAADGSMVLTTRVSDKPDEDLSVLAAKQLPVDVVRC